MEIGLFDNDSTGYPNLPLMKISAWHKQKGDNVEFAIPLKHYDKIYVSKVFGEEYYPDNSGYLNADEIVYGGTGFAISVENGQEVFHKDKHSDLPYEIEHIYPDYSLYPERTKNRAFGFLTRGCPNNCPFCIVSKKEGLVSHKVADLSEWWNGQKHIELFDANLLACREKISLLEQLRDSGAKVNFMQGLDARFLTKDAVDILREIPTEMIHFAFDLMKNEKAIVRGLELFAANTDMDVRHIIVYILTNYNTTMEENLYRIREVQRIGMSPYVMVYRKETAPQIIKDLQRWSNNKFIYQSTDWYDYVPHRKGAKSIRELYYETGSEGEI